ncbi:Vps51/Vps67-domain-containing protein [Podospora appendiculata]|uniref:Vacuolar protein sorting-associated protein 51 homolog n=1 Tax=Podospora appendiculata TaxID=314037 RepID=A0AAE0XC48_9PEZI|nr:Vps51/Vps67-domain-containing protein [Podospora appendiculata]
MSTIASPRDPSAPLPRRMNSTQAVTTPTSSTRPSLDLPPSGSGSPNLSAATTPTGSTTITKRANRAALREYYNLKKAAAAAALAASGATPPTLEITDPLGDSSHPSETWQHHLAHQTHTDASTMAASELDAPDFDADGYIATTLASSSLAALLRTYTRVLGEMRALDAEKKALVYDNYSKLISATETIRRMRTTMDPLSPMASTLDLVIGKVYEQASGIREELRGALGAREGDGDGRRRRTRELAREVVLVPGRVRRLVREGRHKEARRAWEMPRRLLVRWKERGVGGEDVGLLIEEGDAALRGEEEEEEERSIVGDDRGAGT